MEAGTELARLLKQKPRTVLGKAARYYRAAPQPTEIAYLVGSLASCIKLDPENV